jgi:glutamine cyclotransferase
LFHLNELEYCPDDGYLYANVWYSNLIHKIDLLNGNVISSYDLSSLLEVETKFQAQYKNGQPDVLNGIAYDPSEKVFFVSGKQWYLVFKINFN